MMASLKLMAVTVIVVCYLFVSAVDGTRPRRSQNLGIGDEIHEAEHQRLRTTYRKRSRSPILARFTSLMLKKSFNNGRFRREDDENISQQDRQMREYERRLFESLHIIGYIQPTRLYVPEDPQLVPVGTVIGKVHKLHPHGKVVMVWPYKPFRNFTIDEDTGEVTTTALMDFELIRIYNMTIRDFQYNYTDDEPNKQPPMPSPEDSNYVDHYLFVEVIDLNDNAPIFLRDSGQGKNDFSGQVNQNARAGTQILQLRPEDDDSGPRGRIRYKIVTKQSEETRFTIDPRTHWLKTDGKSLESKTYSVDVEALDYGMPPKSSGIQPVSVVVRKIKPYFVDGQTQSHNFSEASARGSVIATIVAKSRSGIPVDYEILDAEARKTFAINHLGEITLLRELDFDDGNETDKIFQFTVKVKEVGDEGQSNTAKVNLRLVNADDHLGMFKTPATKKRIKEGTAKKGGDLFTVEVEDCDCKKNCLCGSSEMIYTLGDTNGFFDITDDGQIRNIKDLDYETQNYFLFSVNVTDPGTNGRTRTSYVEVYVDDDDDTPPKFPVTEYQFYVFENAPKGQVVGVAQAVDPDPSTKPSDVEYTIFRGYKPSPSEVRKYFELGSQGVILVNENNDQFKAGDEYEFEVQAEDKNKKVSQPNARVIVNVIDVNDHQPEFTKCESQTLQENQPIGTVVTTLKATDKDRGLNKLIEYSIQRVQQHNFFAINSTTGVVTTTEKLDREQYDNVFVIAKATDGGPRRSDALRQVGYCQFIVNVEDVNDHHPKFTVAVFDVSVKRDWAVGKDVLMVEAEDPDTGDNAKIEYIVKKQTLKSTNAEVDYFEVDKTSGNVKVKKILTSLALVDEVTIEIQATNTIKVIGPDADAQSETKVVVSLTDKEPLQFIQSKFTGKADENILTGTSVLQLAVKSQAKVFYSMQTEIRQRDDIPFQVETTTGEIKTRKTLDYELKKVYLFAVTVQTGSSTLSSAIVQINVQDIDDIAPIFGNDRYSATISEAAMSNTNVFRVKATDPDAKDSGPIKYVIKKEHDYQTFAISEKDDYAEIKTAPNLKAGFFDRERKKEYTIIVEAYREKRPKLKSTAFVTINVQDENDSPPVFKQKLYTATVEEGQLALPYTVPGIRVEATDNDILENANVSYFITSGNDGRFAMVTVYDKDQKNYGKLRVVSALDVEKTPEFKRNPVYNLTITATDRKHTDTAHIVIKVKDLPENRPEFLEPFYEKFLPENVGPGVDVVQVQVKEPENVEFSLDDKAKTYFAINKETGMITTAGELLDWEKTPVITFPVYAYDKGNPKEKGQTFVRVKVNDVNDAPPYFPDQPYIGYVRENGPAGATVRYINGKDLDNPELNNGNNVKLTYELLTNTGQDPYDKDGKLFEFNSEGLLITKVTLDLEQYRRNLTVRVRAWDHGNPRLSGETDVTIVILDISEYPALFRKPEYQASVSESQPPGFVVLQLTVKDRDFAPTDSYAFSMEEGNNPYAFDIRQETGEIVVAGVLDYETTQKREYTLKIGLMERDSQLMIPGPVIGQDVPFKDFAKVIIKITPGNDHRPLFTNKKRKYETIVPEDIKVGTNLNLSIEALDGDVGFSNNFSFMITKGNMGDWFGIKKDPSNPNKAIVFVQYPLDREYQFEYLMELIVKDYGGVYDTAQIKVTVTDINDNPPVFHPSYYRAKIKENSCTGTTPIAILTVSDPDQPEQGPFTFDFAPDGNPRDAFELREKTYNTTKLYCIREIDREVNPQLTVKIRATDSGSPKLSSTANVFIDVEDKDESRASSGSMRIIVNAIDGKFDGGEIGKTYFVDEDGDGDSNMEYKITAGNSEEFFIKKDDGWISAKPTVKVGKYQLKIQGDKSGERPSCQVDVEVRHVPKEAIENSAAIQLNNVLNRNDFLNPVKIDDSTSYEGSTYYDKFVNMVSGLFGVTTENVFVFSIQMSARVIPGRPSPGVDIRFAIRKDSSAKSEFLPRPILITTLERYNNTVQNLGFKVGMIGIDYCVNETLRVGRCNNVVLLNEEKKYSVVNSNYGLMPPPSYAVAVVSINTIVDGAYSRYKADPDPEYDTCEPEPCLNGGTCHPVKPHGFVCQCPGEYSGPRCQLTTRTFLGDSYIWLHPKTPHNYGGISFEFATDQANGLLLYQGPAVKGGNNGHGDFLAVSLVKGKVKVAVSFGGTPIEFDMEKGPRLNDKKWHHVGVSHQRKDITLTIDHCKNADIVEDDERIVEKRESCEVIAKTKENFEYLNGLGPIQVGGIESMPLEYPSSEFVEYTYFRGCIRKITENLEMYDLAYPVKVANAPIGCTLMAKCPECKNGGYCFPGFSRSVCTCPMGYVGDDCSGRAPRFYYLPNSFTEYKLPGEERRRKRAAANEPGNLLDRYSTFIAMQLRINPLVDKAMLFYLTTATKTEYCILGYEEQKLYFEFKLLDALTRLEMPGDVKVADGLWHNITVTREGNMAVLQVDYEGRVSRNTGGAKKLIQMGSSKLYVGGMPDVAPNATIVNKTVEAAITDIRVRRRRSAGTVLGVTTDGREVKSVDGDMTGCTGSSSYNGQNLDTDPNVKAIRFNVETGCPCRAVLICRNGGICVDAAVPFCQCTAGWTGPTCEDIVYIAPVLGNRVDGRARWQDGGVLIVILCVVLSVLVLAVALLFIKKRREAPYSVPVGDEGQDSIMPYHDDGAGEEDTFNYDIHHLMKYSYRDGHGVVTKSVNGKDIPVEEMELLQQAPDGPGLMSERKIMMTRESVDIWPFILERVEKADRDMSWWPNDEMVHWADEGDDEDIVELSEIDDSDDEEDAEQDWEFLKDWGQKFENLNKIFNPDDDDEDDDEETEA